MTTHSKTVVKTEGGLSIVRHRFWGFRCESLSTMWIVQNSSTGEEVSKHFRLRDAKERLESILAESKPCTPVDPEEAGRLITGSAA